MMERQIKLQWNVTIHPLELLKLKKDRHQVLVITGINIHCSEKVKWCNQFGRQFGKFLQS